jgi:hypothetical protein
MHLQPEFAQVTIYGRKRLVMHNWEAKIYFKNLKNDTISHIRNHTYFKMVFGR